MARDEQRIVTCPMCGAGLPAGALNAEGLCEPCTEDYENDDEEGEVA
jgi:uncharacterized protein (DUF983 family)